MIRITGFTRVGNDDKPVWNDFPDGTRFIGLNEGLPTEIFVQGPGLIYKTSLGGGNIEIEYVEPATYGKLQQDLSNLLKVLDRLRDILYSIRQAIGDL